MTNLARRIERLEAKMPDDQDRRPHILFAVDEPFTDSWSGSSSCMRSNASQRAADLEAQGFFVIVISGPGLSLS